METRQQSMIWMGGGVSGKLNPKSDVGPVRIIWVKKSLQKSVGERLWEARHRAASSTTGIRRGAWEAYLGVSKIVQSSRKILRYTVVSVQSA